MNSLLFYVVVDVSFETSFEGAMYKNNFLEIRDPGIKAYCTAARESKVYTSIS